MFGSSLGFWIVGWLWQVTKEMTQGKQTGPGCDPHVVLPVHLVFIFCKSHWVLIIKTYFWCHPERKTSIYSPKDKTYCWSRSKEQGINRIRYIECLKTFTCSTANPAPPKNKQHKNKDAQTKSFFSRKGTTKSCTSSGVHVGLQFCFTTEDFQVSLATVIFLSQRRAVQPEVIRRTWSRLLSGENNIHKFNYYSWIWSNPGGNALLNPHFRVRSAVYGYCGFHLFFTIKSFPTMGLPTRWKGGMIPG